MFNLIFVLDKMFRCMCLKLTSISFRDYSIRMKKTGKIINVTVNKSLRLYLFRFA